MCRYCATPTARNVRPADTEGVRRHIIWLSMHTCATSTRTGHLVWLLKIGVWVQGIVMSMTLSHREELQIMPYLTARNVRPVDALNRGFIILAKC